MGKNPVFHARKHGFHGRYSGLDIVDFQKPGNGIGLGILGQSVKESGESRRIGPLGQQPGKALFHPALEGIGKPWRSGLEGFRLCPRGQGRIHGGFLARLGHHRGLDHQETVFIHPKVPGKVFAKPLQNIIGAVFLNALVRVQGISVIPHLDPVLEPGKLPGGNPVFGVPGRPVIPNFGRAVFIGDHVGHQLAFGFSMDPTHGVVLIDKAHPTAPQGIVGGKTFPDGVAAHGNPMGIHLHGKIMEESRGEYPAVLQAKHFQGAGVETDATDARSPLQPGLGQHHLGQLTTGEALQGSLRGIVAVGAHVFGTDAVTFDENAAVFPQGHRLPGHGV